jgi:hypothetical protein
MGFDQDQAYALPAHSLSFARRGENESDTLDQLVREEQHGA